MTRWVLVALVLIAGMGVFLRFYQWQEKSLWQDEIFTMASAHGHLLFEATELPDAWAKREEERFDPDTPVSPATYRRKVTEIKPDPVFWEHMTHNIQAPLYPLIVRQISKIFGPDPIGNRIFSILMGILAIPAAFLLGQKLGSGGCFRRGSDRSSVTDRTARSHPCDLSPTPPATRFEINSPPYSLAILLSAITAFSGFQITYSQTARLYALLFLLSVLGGWMMLRWLASKRFGDGLLLVAIVLAGLYTHYFFGILAVFFFACPLWINRREPGFIRQWLTVAGFAGVGFVPGVLLLKSQLAYMAGVDFDRGGLWPFPSIIERTWSGLAELITPKATLLKIMNTVLIIIGGFLAWRQPGKREMLVFSLAWLIAVVGLLGLYDIVSTSHFLLTKRYLMIAAPAVYLLLALGLLALPRKAAGVIIPVVLALLLWNGWQVANGEKFLKKEDYAGAGRVIAGRYQPGDLVLVSHSGSHGVGMAWYLPDNADYIALSRGSSNHPWSGMDLEARLQVLSKNRPTVWLVVTHLPGDLRRELTGWFKDRYRVAEDWEFSSVDVYRLERSDRL